MKEANYAGNQREFDAKTFEQRCAAIAQAMTLKASMPEKCPECGVVPSSQRDEKWRTVARHRCYSHGVELPAGMS